MPNKVTAFKITGPILAVIGLAAIIVGSLLNGIVEDGVTQKVTEGRTLDSDDMVDEEWLTSTGRTFDTYHIFNLTNPDEVLLDGAKPEFDDLEYKFKLIKNRYGEDGPGSTPRFHRATDFVDVFNQYDTPAKNQEFVRYYEYETLEEIDDDTARRLDTDIIFQLNMGWMVAGHAAQYADPNGFFQMAHVVPTLLAPLHIALGTYTWLALQSNPQSQAPFSQFVAQLDKETGLDLGNNTKAYNADAIQTVFKMFGGDLLVALSPAPCSTLESNQTKYLGALQLYGPVIGNLEMEEMDAASLLKTEPNPFTKVDPCGLQEMGALAQFIGFLLTAGANVDSINNQAGNPLNWDGSSVATDWSAYLLGMTENNTALVTSVINGGVMQKVGAAFNAAFDMSNPQMKAFYDAQSVTETRVQANIDRVYDAEFADRLETLGLASNDPTKANALVIDSAAFGQWASQFLTDFTSGADSQSAAAIETSYLRWVAPVFAGDPASLLNSEGQVTGDLSLKYGIFSRRTAREMFFGCSDRINPQTKQYQGSLNWAKDNDYCESAAIWDPIIFGLSDMPALISGAAPIHPNATAHTASGPKTYEVVTGKDDLDYAGVYHRYLDNSNTTRNGISVWGSTLSQKAIESYMAIGLGMGIAPFEEGEPRSDTWIYLNEVLRPLRLNFVEKGPEFKGIKDLRRYESDPSHFDPSAELVMPGRLLNEDATKFDGTVPTQATQYEMLADPQGFVPMSKLVFAKTGAAVPFGLMKPHFLDFEPDFDPDTHYKGMEPSNTKHQTFLNYEPITGAAVEAHKRIQFTFRLDKCYLNTGNYDNLFTATDVTGLPYLPGTQTPSVNMCRGVIDQTSQPSPTLVEEKNVTTTRVNPSLGQVPTNSHKLMPFATLQGDYLYWPYGWKDQAGEISQDDAQEKFTDGIYYARDVAHIGMILAIVFGSLLLIAGVIMSYFGFVKWKKPPQSQDDIGAPVSLTPMEAGDNKSVVPEV